MQQNETTLKTFSGIHAPTPPDSSAATKLSGVGAFYIPLTQGKVAIVDEEDYKWLSQHKWCAHKEHNGDWYAIRNIYEHDKQTTIYMHREILRPPEKMETDHKDGNGLNNQRHNLRAATRSQNAQNRRKKKGVSRFKGVSWYGRIAKWQVSIRIKNKGVHLGYFSSEIEAAQAYDSVARRCFGEFACVNF